MLTSFPVRVLVALLLAGCGAWEDLSSPLDPPAACPTSDEKLAPVVRLAEEGKLAGIREALADRLLAGTRTRVVDLLFDIVKALPPNTFTDLAPAVDQGTIAGLLALLRSPLSTVVKTDAWPALAKSGDLLEECTGRPLLVVLDGLLRDGAFRADLLALSGGRDALRRALSELGVDLSELEHREGFQALSRAFVSAIAQPGFDIRDLTGEGGLLRPVVENLDAPAVDAAIRMVERLLAEGECLAAVQPVARCLIEVDTEDLLAGLVFDVLRSLDLARLDAVAPGLFAGGAEETLDRVVLPILGFLVGDEAGRASLIVALEALLAPDVARLVIPDAIVLIDSGAAQGVLELLVVLARGGGC